MGLFAYFPWLPSSSFQLWIYFIGFYYRYLLFALAILLCIKWIFAVFAHTQFYTTSSHSHPYRVDPTPIPLLLLLPENESELELRNSIFLLFKDPNNRTKHHHSHSRRLRHHRHRRAGIFCPIPFDSMGFNWKPSS